MLKAGNMAVSVEDLFSRVFWKSPYLQTEALAFFRQVKKSEPEGLSVTSWREWGIKRGMSVGQFYNMIRGLVGSGMLEKRSSRWHVSSGLMRELEQLLLLYSAESGYSMRLDE